MARPSLSILIPTYNRARWLEALLHALARDRACSSDRVDIVVSDNASPDHTVAMVRHMQLRFPALRLELVVQPENLGSIGNIKWLINHAEGDYLWVFGDDDEPSPGAVTKVLDILGAVEPAVLHLPHRFQQWPGAAVTESECPTKLQTLASSRELLLEYHHWLSFLTASVVKRDALRWALEQVPSDNPWGPHIWFAIAGLQERCAVAPERLVTGGGMISWSSHKQEYFTTLILEAFDAGFHLVVDEREYGKLLDHRYEVDWATDWEHAPLDELRAAVTRFPTSRMLRWKLAERTKHQGDRAAIELITGAVEGCGDDAVAAELVQEGEALFNEGDLRRAVRKLNKALNIHPTNVHAWCDLGVVLSALSRFEAVLAFERALEIDPDHLDTLLNRADWALVRGLPAQAGHDAERVLALEPGHEHARQILAQVGWLEPASAAG